MPSPGEDIQSWSVTAANNGTADPLIDWHEGQARASVNNSARSMLAAHAKNRNLNNGSIVTTGSANAQQFLSGLTYTTIPTGLRATLKVGAGLTNSTSMTLNMDGLGDTLVKTANGDTLLGGEFVANCYVDLLYNGTNWVFLYCREFFFDLMFGGGGLIVGHQAFALPGTFSYVPSPLMECAIIECFGAGAGGGCASSLANLLVCGGGGGSGGYSRKYVTAADIGPFQTIVVGAGGVGAATPGTGGNGGDTSVGTLCIAKGGAGGGGSLQGGGVGVGGLGGAVGTGDIVGAGTPGLTGAYNATTTTTSPGGGAGGSGPFGGGALGDAVVFYGGTAAGKAATNYGAGGAGSASHGGPGYSPAGNGSPGLIIITEFGGRGTPGRDGLPGPIGPVGPSGPGTGDVLRSGTPAAGMVAQWTDASHIQGVSAITAGSALGIVPNCGRLVLATPNQLRFRPFNGDRIKINGSLLAIPPTGLSIANTSVLIDFVSGNLAPNTNYLLCVYDAGGGTLAAQFFTNLSHAPSTAAGNVGVEVGPADTLSVIGLVRTNASSQFQDDVDGRFVLSWFNRRTKIAERAFTASRSTASTTAVEINSEIAVKLLTWGDSAVPLHATGWHYGDSSPCTIVTQIYIDGTAAAINAFTSAALGYDGPIGMSAALGGRAVAVTEGYHTATLYGYVGSGTATWAAGTTLNASIMG